MEPRWKPSYSPDGAELFIGYADEFDLYVSNRDSGRRGIIIVASSDLYPKTNFDAFEGKHDVLVPLMPRDLHLTPYHMCLIYAAAIEHGLIKQEET
jgi:hypothetical protein